MSWMDKTKESGKTFSEQAGLEQRGLRLVDSSDKDLVADQELEATLKDFRMSVHAWSDATLSRPRTVKVEIKRRSWRVAASWALGCVLAAGGLSGGLLEQHHQREVARIAAEQKAAAERKQVEEQQARAKVSDEVLLAGVDSDVSRDVPSAIEPLAQLMVDDGTK
jgi:hypothetical protein